MGSLKIPSVFFLGGYPQQRQPHIIVCSSDLHHRKGFLTMTHVLGSVHGTFENISRFTIWVWVKIKPPDRRCSSMFPCSRVSFGYLFLNRSHYLFGRATF